MSKYKIILIFALGFLLATGISIYKQKKVANKANKQIATANAALSSMQEKQRQLEDLKRIINTDREIFSNEKNILRQEIQDLRILLDDQSRLNNQSRVECPVPINPYQPRNGGEIWVMPPSFQIKLGPNTYNCKSR